MQIVIDMPDTYITENIIRTAEWEEGSLFDQVLRGALKKAIILPKGHGRLIDADALTYKQTHHGNYCTPFELIDRNRLNNAPTIIEADNEVDRESTTRNCFGCKYAKDNHNSGTEECHLCMWENQYTPTTKKVDCIDRAELLKAIDTWDKFGCDADTKLVPYQDHYIPYIHYDDVIKCIKGMPSVTPQQLIHGKCNQCKYYEGVHNSQGHAPCSYHKIGGVMWNWYCSQFENEVEE